MTFKRFSLSAIGIAPKDFLAVFILVFNALTWFYMITTILFNALDNVNATPQESLMVLSVHYATIIGSSLIGAFISQKIGRLKFLYLWMALGAASSLIPAVFEINTVTKSLAIGFVWAVTFGIGMPSSLSYFADSTLTENRGRIGGIIYLAINLGAFGFEIFLRMSNIIGQTIISIVWRGLGLSIFFLLKPTTRANIIEKRKNPNYISILQNRSFVLYFIPWLMFSLINGLEKPIIERVFGPSFYDFTIIEFVVGSIFALFAGFFSDYTGRKRVTVLGFATLGLAYALLSIAPTAIISWYFYSIIDGIAWGIFAVVFIMVLWGDLAQGMVQERFYVIGGIPYFFSYITYLLLNSYIKLLPDYAAFSLASFFLFLAVLPLMYAPETLAERKIELRRMKGYIEQAKKLREKHTNKSSSKS